MEGGKDGRVGVGLVGIGAILCVCTFMRAIVLGMCLCACLCGGIRLCVTVRVIVYVRCVCSNRVATPPCMSRARMTTWLCCVSWLLPEQP